MKILYFGQLREIFSASEETVEIPGGATVGEIARRVVFPRLGEKNAGRLLYAVNEEFATMESRVGDSDVLAVLPPFSGG